MNQLDQKENTSIDQYVIFKLQDESYGVSIHYVEIIEKVSVITRVPNAATYIMGVINLRGEIVPVVNLRQMFELEDAPITDESRIIILSVDDIIVGLMTDSSSEVLTIPQEDIETASGILSDVEISAIKGIGKVGERMIMMLDIHKILGFKSQDSQERSLDH